MRKIEMETWTIFDHDEEGLAKWAFYHRINPYPVKELNMRIINDLEQSLQSLENIFRPSGPLRLSYRESFIKGDNIQNAYDKELVNKIQTINHDSNWQPNEIRLFLLNFFEEIGGIEHNYIEFLELCGKIKIKANSLKEEINEYPDIIATVNNSPIVIRIDSENEKNPGIKTPDSIMILISIWTDVFMYQTHTYYGNADNSMIASINSPVLSESLKRLERDLNAEIKWWECWYPEQIDKYGFIKPTSVSPSG